MSKIDIISGFLGAGKTTLIKKLLAEAFPGEKLVLIENEFGEISVDSGFLKESGVQISEMSSGCICCSLVGDFHEALKDVEQQFHPDRILIEPSGVGKLSDVIAAVEKTAAEVPGMKLNSYTTVVDGSKVKVYMKNFGEFYNDQVAHAGAIILSRTQKLSQPKLEEAVAMLREKNADAAILTTPWDELDGATVLTAMEKVSMADALLAEVEEHHHHREHDEHCTCGCHDHEHHHEHHEHEHHEHHHNHDEHCDCGCHEHEHHHEHDHHEHDEHCTCGCYDHAHHDHEHHHHAEEVFTSWGAETPRIFTRSSLEEILVLLSTGAYGTVLRAKGIVRGPDRWLEFDYVPGEWEVRHGKPDYTGKLCVIGSNISATSMKNLFGV